MTVAGTSLITITADAAVIVVTDSAAVAASCDHAVPHKHEAANLNQSQHPNPEP